MTAAVAGSGAAPDRLDWPASGKPIYGGASRGCGANRRPKDRPPAVPAPMIFPPPFDGPEYRVNLSVDAEDRLRRAIPRRRLRIRAGEVEQA